MVQQSALDNFAIGRTRHSTLLVKKKKEKKTKARLVNKRSLDSLVKDLSFLFSLFTYCILLLFFSNVFLFKPLLLVILLLVSRSLPFFLHYLSSTSTLFLLYPCLFPPFFSYHLLLHWRFNLKGRHLRS